MVLEMNDYNIIFPFWNKLSEKVKQQFLRSIEQKKYSRGESIYQAGEPPQGLYFIEEGLVGLVMAGSAGQEHLVRLFSGGSFLGHRSLFSDEIHHASSRALEKTKILFLSKEKCFEIMKEQPDLSFVIISALGKQLRLAEEKLVSMTENDVAARIAEALVYLKELHPEHHWTRQEIADFCGSTAPTVIRVLGRFEEAGLIQQQGRDIIILNKKALLMSADIIP